MTPDRRQGIVVRPNGALLNQATLRWWLDQAAAARPAPVRIRRLSRLTPIEDSASRRAPDFGPDRVSGECGSVDRRQASGEAPRSVASVDPAGGLVSPHVLAGGRQPF